MEYVVGIGDYSIAGGQGDIIKTFALSTCVAIVYYSMRKRVMGMAHIQLPSSHNMSPSDKPTRFADTGPGFLLTGMMDKFGLTKSEILISLYGGISSRGEGDCFKIGEKNVQVVKAALRSMGLVYSDVDTGGQDSRTLVAYVSSGIVEVIKRPMLMRPSLPGFGVR